MKGLQIFAIGLLTVTLAGCANTPQRLGGALSGGVYAVAPSRIDVWRQYGAGSLPDPVASARLSTLGDQLLGRRNFTCPGNLKPAQAALFEHLSGLLARNPGLWRTEPGVGPIDLPRVCSGLLILRGLSVPAQPRWLALGVLDRHGQLTHLSISRWTDTGEQALQQLLELPW